jgi:7-keto-8-aminopelargonate synthetase-like enzyme
LLTATDHAFFFRLFFLTQVYIIKQQQNKKFMAKIRHNNFMDTVDEVISDAKKMGVVHLYTEDEELTGRKVKINGKDLFHFGTTGYLGLEQDNRLKAAAVDAIWKYGTQFPLSKTYISHPIYKELEEKLQEMYGYPIIVTKNSTLGHLGVIPCIVRDEDGVILDHQVHWSVQSAAQILKTRNVPVEMIRHNSLEMLEEKIKELVTRCTKIWYMADGVYSMYGDCAPIPQLLDLCKKYPQLHLYFDDVHGMSWAGKNGTGYVMEQLGGVLPENVVLFGTLSKTFGASGAVMVTSNVKMHKQVKNFGGPLTFSAQLEPSSAAAALASAKIHLSPEIYIMQAELADRTKYFNSLLMETDLPLVEQNNCPVFYIGTGVPATGYHFVNRLMNEGFYINLGLYPAVPVKNTGVRITISRHNQKEEMKALVDAMVYHYPKALEETHTTKNKVRAAFKMPHILEEEKVVVVTQELTLQHERTIQSINKQEWNSLLGKSSVFDWDGLSFMEKAFANNERPEHNTDFHYFIIRDEHAKPVLATFLSAGLWKDDILAPASISIQLEEKRKNNPYYLTSKVISMGSLFTEGQQYFLDKTHLKWKQALQTLLNAIETIDGYKESSMTVLRDFQEDVEINEFLHSQGFIKVSMPDSCIIEDLSWEGTEGYINSLSPRSRKHFKKDIQAYEKYFDVVHQSDATAEELDTFYNLFENVRMKNFDLNTFSFPKELFQEMSANPNWEFIVLYMKQEFVSAGERKPVAVMFCYKNMDHTYVPSFIGMDYNFTTEYQTYRQMLYQTIIRARTLGFKKIDFGMSASFEKKKVGAVVIPKVAYIQAKDNFSMELMGVMQNNTK